MSARLAVSEVIVFNVQSMEDDQEVTVMQARDAVLARVRRDRAGLEVWQIRLLRDGAPFMNKGKVVRPVEVEVVSVERVP
jgi:hypothetical protein